jgi:transposase
MTSERETELLDQLKLKDEELARQAIEIKLLRQKLDAFARRYFGVKSEKLSPDQLQLLLQEMETPGPAEGKESGSQPTETELPQPKKVSLPKKRCWGIPEDLEIVETVLEPEEVKLAPDQWRRFGQETTKQLDYEPARFFWRHLIRPTYVRRDDPDAKPLTAPLPPSLQERCKAAPGLIAQVLVAKYGEHLPLYRQQEIYQTRHGVWLPRQSMARSVELGSDWLQPIYLQIRAEVLEDGYVQADETPVDYLEPGNGKVKEGRFWVACKPGGDVFFEWHPSRAAKCLQSLLGADYRGTLQCDGYPGYPSFASNKAGAITLAGCWAHVRRKFHEALEDAPKMAGWILLQIQNLYRIEAELRECRAGPPLRAATRASRSKPIQERIKETLDGLKRSGLHLPKSPMGKAINYALNQWPKLETWLEDGRIEIDNNLVENAIRPTAIGKKNWLFIGAKDAGQRSAVIYTIIASCRRRGIDPFDYLRDVLTRLPFMTNRQIKDITPEAWAKSKQQQQPRLAAA